MMVQGRNPISERAKLHHNFFEEKDVHNYDPTMPNSDNLVAQETPSFGINDQTSPRDVSMDGDGTKS